jgi:hypothetical protein
MSPLTAPKMDVRRLFPRISEYPSSSTMRVCWVPTAIFEVGCSDAQGTSIFGRAARR